MFHAMICADSTALAPRDVEESAFIVRKLTEHPIGESMKNFKIMLAVATAVAIFSAPQEIKAATATATAVPTTVTFLPSSSLTLSNAGLNFGTIVNAAGGTATINAQTSNVTVTGVGNVAIAATGAAAAQFDVVGTLAGLAGAYSINPAIPAVVMAGATCGGVTVDTFTFYSPTNLNLAAGPSATDVLSVGATVNYPITARGVCSGTFDITVVIP